MTSQGKPERPTGREQRRAEVPLDSSQRTQRESLEALEGRRQNLSEEEEMIRRNRRSQMMRYKNRLRATSRR